MKRYTGYKESGAPWLGQVPEHWEVKRLKRVFSETREKATQGDEQLAATQKYGVVSQAQFMKEQDQKLVLALKGTENFKHVEKDDFVISLRAFEGGIERSSQSGCVSPAYTVLRSKGVVSPAFAARLLKTPEFISQISMTYDGIREGKAIKFKDAGPVPLPIPPLSEQAGIAIFLDGVLAKMDSAIWSQERMIELLKERRSAIITQAVTKGLDPKAKMKDSGVPWLGAVNQSWKYLPLKQVVSRPIQNGLGESSSRSDENDPRYIRITDIGSDGKLRDDTFSSVPLEDCKEAFVVKGDILCAAVGGTVGKSYLHQLEGTFCYAGYLVRIRPEASKVTSRFVKYWTESKNYWSQIEANLVKVTIENFSASRYSRTYMPLPTVEEQNAITDYLDDVIAKLDVTITSQEQMIELLKERRSAIITQAVTGQIDVR